MSGGGEVQGYEPFQTLFLRFGIDSAREPLPALPPTLYPSHHEHPASAPKHRHRDRRPVAGPGRRRAADADRHQQRSSAALAAGNLAAIAEPTVARWLTLGYARAHPQTVEQLRSTFLATRAAGYAACAQALSAAHLEQGLAQLEVPTLFISGQADLAVPTALTLGYSQQNPAFKYQALEGSHLLAVENPSAFNAAVLNFIAGHNTD